MRVVRLCAAEGMYRESQGYFRTEGSSLWEWMSYQVHHCPVADAAVMHCLFRGCLQSLVRLLYKLANYENSKSAGNDVVRLYLP